MKGCINKNDRLYRRRLQQSGLEESVFDTFVSLYMDNYGRYPELDELPSTGSHQYLAEQLNLKEKSGTIYANIDKVLETTTSESLEEATVKLNDEYRDLEIELTPLLTSNTIVSIKKRPNKFTKKVNNIENETKYNKYKSSAVLRNITAKLERINGIKINCISRLEMPTEIKENVETAGQVKGFIYNGEIYINTDNATIDTPIHEMLHLLLGSLKFSNNDLYNSIVDAVSQSENYNYLASQFNNRATSDINEELFVTEFAKHLTNQNSVFNTIDPTVVNNILYNINRVLDTAIFGANSVSTLSTPNIMDSSIMDLSNTLGSMLLKGEYMGTVDYHSAEAARILANQKSDLMEKGILTENCE